MKKSRETAKKVQENDSDTTRTRRKKRRNTSKKQRPDTIPGIIAALNDGSLDQRTQAARDYMTIRSALEAAPLQVAKTIVREAMALDVLLYSRIKEEMLKRDDLRHLFDDSGQPNELMRKLWPDVRAGILRGSKALVDLDERAAPTAQSGADESGTLDISGIILEAQHDANTD